MSENIYCEAKILGFEEYLIEAAKDDTFTVAIHSNSKPSAEQKIEISTTIKENYIDGFDLFYETKVMK